MGRGGALLPGGTMTWGPALTLTALSPAFVTTGLWRLPRRDVTTS